MGCIMQIKINRKILSSFGCFLAMIAIISFFIFILKFLSKDRMLGGMLYTGDNLNQHSIQTAGQQKNNYSEKYQRPSGQPELSNPFTLQTFINSENTITFQDPEDVIYAYYGILKEASDMYGYSGGCGTVGEADIPYPYAYRLFTSKARQEMSLQEFKDSFRGTGHITFLQIHSLPIPPETPADTRYFMVEIEVITGRQVKNDTISSEEQISYFAYYFGIVTVEKGEDGWGIQEINYYPENFLCAPYHGWDYDAEVMVNIVFKDNLKVIDQIMNRVEKDGMIYIFAPGGKRQYRFDFVRLTNGHDILINENIMINGKWRPTELLTADWKYLKLQKSLFTS